MPLTGEYKPSTSEWARTQAERFEASNGAEANLLRGVPETFAPDPRPAKLQAMIQQARAISGR